MNFSEPIFPGFGIPAASVPPETPASGVGMLTAPLTGIVLAQVRPQQAGTVSGLQSTVVQLGNSIGVAVIGVVFFGALAGGFVPAFRASLIPLAALPLAAAVAVQFVPKLRA